MTALHLALEALEQSPPTPRTQQAIAALRDAIEQKRDREADRARFTDPGFNRWLDEAITENGEFTVWDQIGDVCAAWHGWENRQFYASPQPAAPQPEQEGLSRSEWVAEAVRVYLVAGDDEATAKECARHLWSEQDHLSEELDDPREAALADIEGRPTEEAAPQPDESEWRKLAKQFDAQRMALAAHLQMLLKYPERHRAEAEAFLAATPSEQIGALAAPQPEIGAMAEKAMSRFDAAMDQAEQEKAERVHALVNAGPLRGMSEAFNAYMGAEVWIDPAYAPDASTWAAAWKAALAAPQPVAVPHIHVTEEMHVAAVKVLLRANGTDGLPQRMMNAMLAAAPQAPSREPLGELASKVLEKLEAWQAVCDRITDQYGGVVAGVDFGALGRANRETIERARGITKEGGKQ